MCIRDSSKTFNLACFYSAYVVIKNKALRDQYNVVYDDYHFDYNYVGIEALITAYNECEYYVDQQNEYFRSNIELVKSFIAKNMPEVKVIEPEASYLLWIDFRAWNLTPFEPVSYTHLDVNKRQSLSNLVIRVFIALTRYRFYSFIEADKALQAEYRDAVEYLSLIHI